MLITPELVAQLQARDARSRPLTAEAWASLLSGSPAALGPANAKVTVVEFSDFQCPYCAQAHETVHKIRERYSDKVRIIFRHFPLPFHEHARLAAQAARGQRSGNFGPSTTAVQPQNSLDRNSLDGYSMSSPRRRSLSQRNRRAPFDRTGGRRALARSLSVDGTPTMSSGRRADNATTSMRSPPIDAALAHDRSPSAPTARIARPHCQAARKPSHYSPR